MSRRCFGRVENNGTPLIKIVGMIGIFYPIPINKYRSI